MQELVKAGGIKTGNDLLADHQGWSLRAVIGFGHGAAGLEVGADVVLFKRDLVSLEIHAHQLAGKAAGLGKDGDFVHEVHIVSRVLPSPGSGDECNASS